MKRQYRVEHRRARWAARAARRMHAAGLPRWQIKRSLRLTEAAYRAALSRSRCDLWGSLSGEMRRLMAAL